MDAETKEIMTILQEECAETIQMICKCMRFGPDQCNPLIRDSEPNRILLEQELGDLLAMVELLIDKDIGITESGMQEAKKKKFEKLKRWSTLTINK